MNLVSGLEDILDTPRLLMIPKGGQVDPDTPELVILTDGSGVNINASGDPIIKGTVVYSEITGKAVGVFHTELLLEGFELFYGNLVLNVS